MSCYVCRKPTAKYMCRQCRRMRVQLRGIHGPRRIVPMADPGRATRIARFSLLASARLPLFAGHR